MPSLIKPSSAISLVVFILITATVIPAYADYFGLGGENCRTSDDCLNSASCVLISNTTFTSTPCSTAANRCICRPKTGCVASSDCVRGEACYQASASSRFCLSCKIISMFVGNGGAGSIDGYDNCQAMGLDYDHCRTTDMCKPSRVCIEIDEGLCLSSSGLCECRPPPPGFKRCTDCTPCDSGESCFQINDRTKACTSEARLLVNSRDRLVGDVCTTRAGAATQEPTDPPSSPTPTPTPSSEPADTSSSPLPTDTPTPTPTPSPGTPTPTSASPEATDTPSPTPVTTAPATSATTVPPQTQGSLPTDPPPSLMPPENTMNAPCIAMRHLDGHAETTLVFGKKHRPARVLCDSKGSCATAGHIVVFQGRALRLARYCETARGAACTEEQMLVNSPRMRAGVRVRSLTDELEFTALSARYETAGEELVLRALIAVGM